jgi:hypothetical protein
MIGCKKAKEHFEKFLNKKERKLNHFLNPVFRASF